MSLILEALKKAERQHKLGEVPGISAQVSEQSGHGGHRLGWGLLSVLAVAMLGVGLYIGSMQSTPPPAAKPQMQTQSESEMRRTSGELSTRPVHSAPQSASPVPGAGLAAQQVESPLTEDKTQPIDQFKTEISSTQPAPLRPEPVKPRPEPPPPRARPLDKMPSGFVSNLPTMNIDIHSFDPRPARRYVLINMEKYHEGDYLAEGPHLIEILPDGVVMEHMGERFIFPLGNF
jgi:general secretion pathway protein B